MTRLKLQKLQKGDITSVAPDVISGPGRNPAVFSNPAPAGYDRRI